MAAIISTAVIVIIGLVANAKATDTECGKMEYIDPTILLPIPWIINVCTERYICAGVILDARHILTSNNCIRRYTRYGYRQRYSNNSIYVFPFVPNYADRGNCLDYPGRLQVSTAFIKQLEFGNINDYDNDLGMIRLTYPLKFNEHVKPICLMNSSDSPLNYKTCRFMDRGPIGYSMSFSPITVSPYQTCANTLLSGAFNNRTMFCSLGNQRYFTPINQGNAFVCENSQGQWVLFGIGLRYTNIHSYDGSLFYTNLTSFLPWIKSHIARSYLNN